MKLYGSEWTRREIEARVGRVDQVGGLRRRTGANGPEQGVEYIEFDTGAGLSVDLVPGRGLDLHRAQFGGAALAYLAPAGLPHAAFYDARGAEWVRTFGGGLLSTCGLTQVGSPCVENGRELGQHGRVHHTPAQNVCAEKQWRQDEYELRVTGVVEERSLFGEQLELRREITGRLGENRIHIRDTVTNVGFRPAPHMILYHFNFGFPLLNEKTTFHFPGRKIVPREPGLPTAGHDIWQAPDAAMQERVFYHEELTANRQGWAEARIDSPEFPLAGNARGVRASLGWDTRTLPILVQWWMPGAGEHVLGIEPANCHVGGRVAERARGSLVTLAPGEARVYELVFSVDALTSET